MHQFLEEVELYSFTENRRILPARLGDQSAIKRSTDGVPYPIADMSSDRSESEALHARANRTEDESKLLFCKPRLI